MAPGSRVGPGPGRQEVYKLAQERTGSHGNPPGCASSELAHPGLELFIGFHRETKDSGGSSSPELIVLLFDLEIRHGILNSPMHFGEGKQSTPHLPSPDQLGPTEPHLFLLNHSHRALWLPLLSDYQAGSQASPWMTLTFGEAPGIGTNARLTLGPCSASRLSLGEVPDSFIIGRNRGTLSPSSLNSHPLPAPPPFFQPKCLTPTSPEK